MARHVVQASAPGPVGGPTLIRLLARISDRPFAPPAVAASDRLGEWIDWPRAVTLSRALDEQPSGAGEPADAGPLADECARVRAGLIADIDQGPGPIAADAGFGPFQQHVQAIQRALQTATGYLRGDLRERLAGGSPQQASLAEVDAVMEATLNPREHALLASVPALLGLHFERLRQAAPPDADAWLATFGRDMHSALLAELDLRFEPIEALLAALRPR